ncbi:MAG: outer membrane beta-barrel protein [Desulforhopalus sp.]|nr:outer membrane beta-barrel protein [Desulforhopalus sp.]
MNANKLPCSQFLLQFQPKKLKTTINYAKGKKMKKALLISAGCTMLLSVSSIAYSGADGLYVGGNLGLAIANDSDVTDSTAPGITLEFESDMGYALGGAIGYGFGNFRIEGEIAYQTNDLDQIKALGVSVDATGDTSSLTGLLNGYYDFNNTSPFTPYISGGVGVAKVEINDVSIPGSGFSNVNDDHTVFAYQVGVGVAYAIKENLSFDVKYRYFATSDLELDTTDFEYSSNNFYAGIRYTF